jgi:hypothetical protein
MRLVHAVNLEVFFKSIRIAEASGTWQMAAKSATLGVSPQN